MAHVVLVTGVSDYVGMRLAAVLAADPDVERIIGVDTRPPKQLDVDRLGRTEFVRVDIRNPLIAKVIAQAKVDTVVHASVTASERGMGGRTPMKELNVLGTMQLLAACQKSETVRRLVVKSATAVYGSSPRDPAVFTENTAAKLVPRAGYAKDCIEVESYVRGFIRRRPDVAVTVLRLANLIGPTIDTPITRCFAMPVVPTPLGYDPRLQFLHELDAIEALRLAALSDRPGVFNVAGAGAMLLSQAIRRAGRVALPVPAPALQLASRFVRRAGVIDFSPSQLDRLSLGRVADITALRTRFGFTPAFTTGAAFDDFITGRPISPLVPPEWCERAESFVPSRVRLAARHG
jgi:UDP-glucose 4-epimerase